MDFSNETVIITGASNGIGRGLAKAYIEKGAHVIACDIDIERGKQLVEETANLDGACTFRECDVSDPDAVETLFHWIKQQNHEVSIVVNNAGVSHFQNLFDIDIEQWDQVINTNLRSVFLFSKNAASLWKDKQTGGRIVNIASTRAFMSEADSEAYAATKGGITALTHASAASLSAYGVRVNSISPGWIHTGDEDDLRTIDHTQHLSNRVGNVQDIVKAAFYLTDPDNDFVNGENIVVDGGMTRKMIYEH
ncbi:SDR family oxidoreductase [Halobacillus litoralis]|uniref:SDR family NAD(P)-dependent oxidoreductase n=1 Tax=Halobacillus litoralis TaxID=45668 RepID=UPI001CD2F10A|nr:SDR family oxidoreductase [Halobacillus litoralis]MCA0969491.1 SDR family oxidoreductase [Halobacillus litoralis]